MWRIIILLAFFVFSVALGQGQEWIVYNTSNSGLPANDVWAIVIDNAGNI